VESRLNYRELWRENFDRAPTLHIDTGSFDFVRLPPHSAQDGSIKNVTASLEELTHPVQDLVIRPREGQKPRFTIV